MAFQFSLQTAMDVCKQEKEAAHKQYEVAVDAFECEAMALFRLLKQKEDVQAATEKMLVEKASVSDLLISQACLDGLQQQIGKQQLRTDQARVDMLQKKATFQQHAVSYKQYERLREKKRLEQKQAENRREQQLMDELCVTRFKRKYA